ncbi:mechanosensitive ion channel [Geovibrio thiophilus]|uniref:Mechanosensitive ion channel n=2 Tax=Geovibrio thiophilus TaxID=139438 RepID=A0A3R5V0P5_9BACT|nr:mechanosensitive ion channel [Geovibrio thiophilus]
MKEKMIETLSYMNIPLEGLIKAGVILLFVFLAYAVPRFFILRLIYAAVKRSSVGWDDVLLKHKVFNIIFTLPPVFVVHYGMQFFPAVEVPLLRLLNVYITVMVVVFGRRLLRSAAEVYEQFPVAVTRPIKGYVQLVEIFLFIMGAILVVCFFLGKSPWAILSGIGAMTAILMLVFKDTIMNFVASLLIIFNDLVHVGDWIEVPGTGADGTVTEMALHTVKVQNFDNTIVTIPTHKLIDGSFRNWRGMQQSGGRRIRRSILIDQKSIRFLTDEDIKRLGEVEVLNEYLSRKLKEIDKANEGIVGKSIVNGRHLTNIGTLRAYMLEYLRQKKEIDKSMTFLVRQLAPTPEGLPLEVYVFSNDINWVNYEGIQSDIFDHLLAAVHEFDLRIFQNPGSYDISDLADKLSIKQVNG